jgi:uncharacterized protein GlcG (DUF336 family)
MKKLVPAVSTVVVLAALTTAAPLARAQEGLVSFKLLTPAVALELAQATMADCRKRGFQVAVAVVDRFGITQVILRDRFAGPHTPETARRKAWTAVSFRTDTLELADLMQPGQPQSGAREVEGALMLGGGVPVEAAGSVVGGVGVSGAPGGAEDDTCARAGIEAITEKIAF